jgi:hypothetical protein
VSEKRRYCELCDLVVPASQRECKECGADTVAVPKDEDGRSLCLCGHGWTFDFQQRRVYCRRCEGEKRAS